MRIINKSLIRYKLIAGAEKEAVILLATLCGCITYSKPGITTGCLAGTVYLIGMFFLRRLAKYDPIYLKIFQRALQYQNYYSAKTSKWRTDSGYKAK